MSKPEPKPIRASTTANAGRTEKIELSYGHKRFNVQMSKAKRAVSGALESLETLKDICVEHGDAFYSPEYTHTKKGCGDLVNKIKNAIGMRAPLPIFSELCEDLITDIIDGVFEIAEISDDNYDVSTLYFLYEILKMAEDFVRCPLEDLPQISYETLLQNAKDYPFYSFVHKARTDLRKEFEDLDSTIRNGGIPTARQTNATPITSLYHGNKSGPTPPEAA